MNLNGIYAVINHSEGNFRVTAFTREWFGGDPNYHCEAVSPKEVSIICKENPRLRIPSV